MTSATKCFDTFVGKTKSNAPIDTPPKSLKTDTTPPNPTGNDTSAVCATAPSMTSVLRVLENVQQKTIKPIMEKFIKSDSLVATDEYDIADVELKDFEGVACYRESTRGHGCVEERTYDAGHL